MVDEKAANKGLSDQIRACGLFFVCFIILFVIPLIYHNFIFLTCLPMYKVNKASAIAIMIIFHLVLILLLVSYYKTIFTDAGVVPYEMDEAWQNELSLASRFGLEAEVSERVLNQEKAPLNLEKKMDGRQRYCRKCNKFKPDRAHHCKYCGRCVLKMDHHCPWVNNCIGFRNYKFFMLFCTYVTLECLYVTMILFAGIVGAVTAKQDIVANGTTFEYVAVFCLCLIITMVMMGFTGFHYSLVMRNVSTIEHVEKRDPSKKDADNPFDQGPRSNFEQVFGKNPLLWFLPVTPENQSGPHPILDGVHFPIRDTQKKAPAYGGQGGPLGGYQSPGGYQSGYNSQGHQGMYT